MKLGQCLNLRRGGFRMNEPKNQVKKDLSQDIEAFLDKVTTHPLFLEGVSSLLNLNSYRKLFLKRSMQTIWKTLELPNKRDQEKTLYLVTELQYQIQKLEKELAAVKGNAATAEKSGNGRGQAAKSTKAILTALQ